MNSHIFSAINSSEKIAMIHTELHQVNKWFRIVQELGLHQRKPHLSVNQQADLEWVSITPFLQLYGTISAINHELVMECTVLVP